MVLALGAVIAATLPTVAGVLPLSMAVLLHEGSTLLVVVNSLRWVFLKSPVMSKSIRKLAAYVKVYSVVFLILGFYYNGWIPIDSILIGIRLPNKECIRVREYILWPVPIGRLAKELRVWVPIPMNIQIFWHDLERRSLRNAH